MKHLLILLAIFFSTSTFAANDLIKVDGEKARNLIQALYRSGIALKSTTVGFETETVARILCEGRREYQFSEGILSDLQCTRNPHQVGILLKDSTALETALSSAGAVVDAAMGKWWVYASDIKCSVDFEDLIRFRCQFVADVNL